jgi:hypothetical protein
MSDLVGGKYPQNYGLAALLGGLSNAAQANIPARSNAEWFGVATMTDGALAGSGIGCFVPVPVDIGTEISKISILAGATAGSKMTHQFAALYAGTGAEPALIEQSTDTTNAAIAEKTLLGWKLTKPALITAANAPNGFVYAEIAITVETTVPTAASIGTPAGVNYKWTTNGPLFLSFTAGSALGATAAATTGSPSAKVVAPIIVLT